MNNFEPMKTKRQTLTRCDLIRRNTKSIRLDRLPLESPSLYEYTLKGVKPSDGCYLTSKVKRQK